MAIERKDLVQDTATSTGTGSFVMAGTPAAGFRAFSVHTNGASFDYRAYAGSDWEIGVGTWNGASIARAPVTSSNGNALVNFSTAPTVMEIISASSLSSFLTSADALDAGTLPSASSLNTGDTVLLLRGGVLYTALASLFGSGGASAPAATVTGVSISPSTANVAGGATQQLTATVTGTNSPSQAVTWTTNGGSVNSSGLFTAPAATGSVQTITVTATSTLDNTKSGTATMTIAAASAQTITVNTPATQTVGTPFTVTGTYANGTPTALQYRLSDDAAGVWTDVANPTISGGTYSFSQNPSSATAGRNISVRDKTTLVSATSGSYVVNAAVATVAYTYKRYTGGQALSTVTGKALSYSIAVGQGASNPSNSGVYGGKISFSPNIGVDESYWMATPNPAKIYLGWTRDNQNAPALSSAADPTDWASIPVAQPATAPYWTMSVTHMWVPNVAGTYNMYLWICGENGIPVCVNPSSPCVVTVTA